jgi:hypothetical protein
MVCSLLQDPSSSSLWFAGLYVNPGSSPVSGQLSQFSHPISHLPKIFELVWSIE